MDTQQKVLEAISEYWFPIASAVLGALGVAGRLLYKAGWKVRDAFGDPLSREIASTKEILQALQSGQNVLKTGQAEIRESIDDLQIDSKNMAVAIEGIRVGQKYTRENLSDLERRVLHLEQGPRGSIV